jgi:DNA-binding transcriptional LysR family regulator
MAELRALDAVKSAGTLSAAAQMLGVSQPTLSQHIREVEGKLDLVLFDRHRRGIEPTRAGSVMLRLASALQTDFAQAAEELSIATRADTRPIRIASMAVTSGGLLALALGQFAAASSSAVPTVVLEAPRELLLEHLRHGRADFFVGRLPDKRDSEDLHRELLCLDTAVVIASARHPLATRRRVDAQVLQSQRWVVPADDTAFHEQIAQTLRQAACPPPNGIVHSYSMHAIPAIVATSDLLGFLPMSLYAALSGAGNLRRLPLELPWVPAELGILARADAAAEERLQPLLRTLRAVAGSARVAGAGTWKTAS